MNINISDNSIYLSDINPQNSRNIRVQLSGYGFRLNSDGVYTLYHEEPMHILTMLFQYMDGNQFDYQLTENTLSFIERNQRTDEEFDGFKENALRIKNGDIDEDEFSDFRDYLDTLPRKLRDHQEKSAFHLYSTGNGANFSVPGAGKTAVVLSVYEKLKREGIVDTLFVLGPTACFYPWIDEFQAALGREPESRVILSGLDPTHRDYIYNYDTGQHELYLVSFQTLTNDIEKLKTLFERNKVFFVVDEAHYVKRDDGLWGNAALQLSPEAVKRCVLTGTPMPRSYTDLYNIFDLLWPDNKPINRQTRLRLEHCIATDNELLAEELLNDTVGPLFYRVRKSDLGLGPQIFHPTEVIRMNPHERQIYNTIVNEITDFTREEFRRESEVRERLRAGRMIRLRQATSYSRLLETAIQDYSDNWEVENSEAATLIKGYDELEKPAKLERLVEMVQEFQSEQKKVVIWTHFIGTLNLIKEELEGLGIRVKTIYGDVPVESNKGLETREHIRKEFMDADSGLDVLVANPGACAESISLHKTCFDAIYYDLSYNCAEYLQSLDRIHRVGGSEDVEVNYYLLQYENTFEADIVDNLEDKRRRMYGLVEQDYPVYSMDLRQEFNLEPQIYDSVFGQN
jgi:SNF2 family DNA or RNA helicase